MSVGSVCVLGEPWLELLAKRFLLWYCCCAAATAATAVMETLCSNFSELRTFCFLNKGRFSTLSPQSAGFFLKITCEMGKFRARRV